MWDPSLPYNLTFEASYPTPYATSQFLSMILLSMIGQKHTPKTTKDIKDSYDYIIVGAGTAGSVLAARLAEKDCVTILLLEAGKSPPKVTDIPTAARSFIQSDIDWNYRTAPQEHTGVGLVNRSVAWPSGKTIGGGSVISGMLNFRGNKKNYDDWAAGGASGWSYEEILPYFVKLEDNTDEEYSENGYHGIGGPVTVSKPPYDSELKAAVLEAAEDKGYRIGDINGPDSTGFYDLQATMRVGQRCSAAKAYLVPNDHKENLDIVSEAFVRKIVIDNSQARGVVFDFEGQTREVRAIREVILSAGTVNTAQLLMLSGVGPRRELEKHKILVKADLPVGKNLQEHWGVFLAFELSEEIIPFAEKQVDESNIIEYISSKTGVLTSPQGFAVSALLDQNDTKGINEYPDYQLYFWEGYAGLTKDQHRIKPEYFEAIYGPYKEKPFYWCLSQILHPKSKGKVTLHSSDPYDPPIIDPKYFSHPEDMEVIVAVKRIRNLRVVDASVMPIIPGGNTIVPTMMVAEKASDMIKETIRCESDNDMHFILLEDY
ncbi:glucose dehydrogenase [Trichonephila inaurata madagascariensis]|uniref:Glucose dehydrogenase n=1 Tax=Trichonephila inaurata madagascariensis TaxID=2747483 RepID=A0A8X6YXC5_9ARAC|nr:glucose dehydrogenase [Trichonephila inaurata madagascariensis]